MFEQETLFQDVMILALANAMGIVVGTVVSAIILRQQSTPALPGTPV
jgi:hypothetical protein